MNCSPKRESKPFDCAIVDEEPSKTRKPYNGNSHYRLENITPRNRQSASMNLIDIFPWDDNFSTGLPTVDDQHRKLVQLLNSLASHVAFRSDVRELGLLFDELADYTVYHFETEEGIWHEFLKGDPLEQAHRSTHASFINEVVRFKVLLGSTAQHQLAEEALGFLARWLVLLCQIELQASADVI
jgi:hemerythrin-like metal-binding protein